MVSSLSNFHVDAALPGDPAGVDVQGVPLLDVVVEHGRQQVVRGTYGVEIAGKVEVYVLHRHHLGVSAPCGAALDAEDRSERGLTQSHYNVLADPAETIRQPDGGGRLALPGGSGCDRRHKHELSVGAVRLLQDRRIDLCLVSAVKLEIFLIDAGACGYLADGSELAFLRYLNIAFILHAAPHLKYLTAASNMRSS